MAFLQSGERERGKRVLASCILVVLVSSWGANGIGHEGGIPPLGEDVPPERPPSGMAETGVSLPVSGANLLGQISSAVASAFPAVSDWLSGLSGGALHAGEEGAGGDSPLGVLYGLTQKAGEAVNASLVSDQARESLWIPLHEQMGLVKDLLGVSSSDLEGVRSVSRLLAVSHLPVLRFAVERGECKDPESDLRALRIVREHPSTKKILAGYVTQDPDRNLRGAPGELALLLGELKEYAAALKNIPERAPLPVSLLGGVEVISAEIGLKVNRYLATVSRYLLYTERFPRNKRSLLVFAWQILPRVLQIFAVQIEICRHLWLFLDRAPSSQRGERGGGEAESPPASAPPPFSTEGVGAIVALAQNLGFRPVAEVSHPQARGLGRRLLARVQAHIGALHALSRGCLSATSLSFQARYAEAEASMEAGEPPAVAFAELTKNALALAASLTPPAAAPPMHPPDFGDPEVRSRVMESVLLRESGLQVGEGDASLEGEGAAVPEVSGTKNEEGV